MDFLKILVWCYPLMNLKLHFMDSHVNYLLKTVGDYSKEQAEHFHQEKECIEEWMKGKTNQLHWLVEDKRFRHKRKKWLRKLSFFREVGIKIC